MKLSFREKALLISLVIVGLGYLFYSFLYSPVSTKRDIISRENSQLKYQVALFGDKSRQKSGIDRDAQEKKLMEGFQEQVIKVPGDIMLPESVLYLQKSAKAAGVTLTSLVITPGTATAVKPAGTDSLASATKEVSINLTAKGGYSGLKAFLLAIHKAPRLYRIDTAKMQSNYQQGSAQPASTPAPAVEGEDAAQPVPVPTIQNEITMNVTMVTFYQEFNAPGFKDNQERVQPGQGQDNPFTI